MECTSIIVTGYRGTSVHRMQQLYVAVIIFMLTLLVILTIKKCFWSRKKKVLSYAPPTFVLR